LEREIKPGVFSEIIVIVVMQCVDLFDVCVIFAEPEEEVVVVVVVVDGAVEMGGNEGGVLDYGFPCFANTDGDDYRFDW
jgi:hypothetical protein